MNIVIAKCTIEDIFRVKSYDKTQVYIFPYKYSVHILTVFIGSESERILHRYILLESSNIGKYVALKIILSSMLACFFPKIFSEFFDPITLWVTTYFSISLVEIEDVPASELFHELSKRSLFPFFLDQFFVVRDFWHSSILEIFINISSIIHIYDLIFLSYFFLKYDPKLSFSDAEEVCLSGKFRYIEQIQSICLYLYEYLHEDEAFSFAEFREKFRYLIHEVPVYEI